MLEEVAKIIYLLAMGQGILISYTLILQQSVNRLSNRLLIIFLLAMLLPLWEGYIQLGAPILKDFSIPRLFWILPWIYGPLLYFYTLSVCDKNFALKRSHCLHLLIFVYPAIVITNLDQIASLVGDLTIRRLSWALFFIHLFSYIALCVKRIGQYQKALQHNFSYLENKSLSWLKTILAGFSAIYLLDLTTYYILVITNVESDWYFHSFVLAESVYIFVLGFTALRNPMIYPDVLLIPESPKYRNSTLEPELAARLIERINQLMEQEELFMQSDLTLSNLAERLNVNSHHLSQVINNHMGLSFYELINRGRINKAKYYLKSSDSELTILEIAYKVGFNNKTSFNNAFKKFVEITPSEYKKQAMA